MSNIAIFGSTGLIGSNLLKHLEHDTYFSKVNVITRKPFHFKNSKFKNIVIDFNDINSIQNSLKNCSELTKINEHPIKTYYQVVNYSLGWPYFQTYA